MIWLPVDDRQEFIGGIMDGTEMDRANWIGNDGKMRVEGREIDLRDLDEGELAALTTELAIDADLIRGQLRDVEVEENVAGVLSYDRQLWRNRARLALALKKKQIAAIQAEFGRRKTLVPPLDNFAFSAVFHVLGEEVLKKVEDEARKLHGEFCAHQLRKGRAINNRLEHRGQVCGIKVQHKTEEGAEQQILAMKADGLDVRDLVVYLCPWCLCFHVGNSPIRKRRRRRRQQEKAQKEQLRTL